MPPGADLSAFGERGCSTPKQFRASLLSTVCHRSGFAFRGPAGGMEGCPGGWCGAVKHPSATDQLSRTPCRGPRTYAPRSPHSSSTSGQRRDFSSSRAQYPEPTSAASRSSFSRSPATIFDTGSPLARGRADKTKRLRLRTGATPQRGLGGGQSPDRHAKRRAGHVVQPELVAE
jgi:hypothetical protein